ncbi:MAG: hypothetical protein GXO91_07725 [FCB group bacterium]|nr:hypothetical protein [FCB group bacterium]
MIFKKKETAKSNRNRWYDPPSKLGLHFEKMQFLREHERDAIIVGIKNIIMKHDPDLINRHILEFASFSRNRWYDADPYTWLIINSLKYAGNDIITEVIKYLEKKINN